MQRESESKSSAPLCTRCQRFFGSPVTGNMCSSCFRICQKQKILTNTGTIPQTTSPSDKQYKPLQKETSEKPAEVQSQDPSRCFACDRKVGLLGTKCRCEHTYCKLHRMPEEHDCTYDFAREGKLKLAQSNPVVRQRKVSDIT